MADGHPIDYTGDTGVLGTDGSQAIQEHKCLGGKHAFARIVNHSTLKGEPTLVVDLASAGNGYGADLVFSNIRLCNEDRKLWGNPCNYQQIMFLKIEHSCLTFFISGL